MIQPQYIAGAPRIGNPRTVRAATQARIGRSSRARYTGILRVSVVLGSLLALLMGYVLLTSNLTGLTYALSTARHDREAMQEENVRLEDRIAALRSDDRLAALATRMGMTSPQRFALVTLDRPHIAQARSHFAVFSSLAGLFMPAVARRP